MADPTLTGALLAAVDDRARPLLTYYGATQRIGLSGATLENWAAKIANYLREEAGLFPGDAVGVAAPEHWQTAAVLLGGWWAGLRVDVGDDAAAQTRVVFTDLAGVDAYPDAEETVVMPLDPFAGRTPELPPFAADDVLAHLLAPWAVGAALVYADPAGDLDLAAIADTEHTDLTLT